MKARKIVRNRRKMDEKGVSPVIGVILMVAATIVIAAVVLGMLGGFSLPGKVYSISVTAEERNIGGTPTIYVTYHGGPDAGSVVSFNNVIVDGADSGKALTTTVGSSVSITSADLGGAATVDAGAGNDHVIVTATFADGSVQTVLDTWV